MEDLLHIRLEDGSEEWVSPARASEFAKDMREAGSAFEVLRDVRTKGGEVVQRREDEADEAGDERVWPTRAGSSTYTLDQGEQVEVADARREEFLSDMEAEGRTIARVQPKVSFLSNAERDEALRGSRDWGSIAASAIEGPKFVGRLGANLVEGVVAIPTMLSMGADALAEPFKQAADGKLVYDKERGTFRTLGSEQLEGPSEPSAPTKLGLKGIEAIEDFKHRHLAANFETGRDDWRSLDGIVRNVATGSTAAMDFVAELAAAGAAGEVAAAVKTGSMATIVPFSEKAAAARAAQAAAKAAAAGTTANEIEKRAASKALASLGGTVDVSNREAASAFAKAYARALPLEQFKAGAEAFASAMTRPTYFKAAIPARNGAETYLAYAKAGSDHEKAAAKAMGDAAWTYLMLALGDGTGAYAGAMRTTGASQLVRAIGESSGQSALRATLTGEAIKIAGAATAQGGATYGHLKTLQEAVGEEALPGDQLIASTVISALTGAAMSGIGSIGEIRRAILADKTAAALRAQAAAQQRTNPTANEKGWLLLEGGKAAREGAPAGREGGPSGRDGRGLAARENGANAPQGGAPRAEQPPLTQPEAAPLAPQGAPHASAASTESALFRPVAVRGNGDVLLADGSLYRAQSQSWLLPGGAVTDAEGNSLTVAPEANAYAAATGEALPEQAGTPGAQNGIPTVTTGLAPADLNLYTMLSQGDSAVYNVPLAKLSVNDRIRQFKADADPKTGVVRGQELWGEYQAIPAKPILAMEFNDGHLEVVTGRHRLDLARRNHLETIPANLIYERDGWTLEKAQLLDAMDNILDEKGTDADFVKFFASAGIDRATAQQKGLIARRKGKDAFDIAKLGSDDLAAAVINEDRYVTAPIAAAIAREAPKAHGLYAEGVQRAVMRSVMDTRMDADGAAIMARSLIAQHQAAKTAQSAKQLDLFGADDTALAIGAEEAKYAAAKRREATKAIQRINAARTKSDALELKASWAKSLGITEATDPQQLDEVIARLQATANAWANYYLDPALQQEANAHARTALGLSAHVAEQPDGSLAPIGEAVDSQQSTEGSGEATEAPESQVQTTPEDDDQLALFDAPSGLSKRGAPARSAEPVKRVTATEQEVPTSREEVINRSIENAKRVGRSVIDKNGKEVAYVNCPALNSEVLVGRRGLRHSLNGSKERVRLNMVADMHIGELIENAIFISKTEGDEVVLTLCSQIDIDGKPALVSIEVKETEYGIELNKFLALYAVNAKAEPPYQDFTSQHGPAFDERNVAQVREAWQALFAEGKEKHNRQKGRATEPMAQQAQAPADLGARGASAARQQEIGGYRIVASNFLKGQWQNLGGAPGTPRGNARMALSMQDLVMLYHELTGGKLPHLRKSLMGGRALGVYHLDDPLAGNKRGTIELITRIFGLIEDGDVEAETRQLIASGYFRHLDPNWSANATPKDIQGETDRSNQALEKAITTLARKRIENNFTQLQSARVMAHELWHLVDDRDGALRGRGNILGHIAAYKHYIKQSLPIAAITRKEILDEAEPLIAWWHGARQMPDYYKKPEEMFAELGAIFFVAPSEMQARAPKCYNAFAFAIEQHPQCKQAYDQLTAYIAAGTSGRLAQERLAETWSREQQALYRKLTEQVYRPDTSLKTNLMRLNAYLFDKRGPALMMVNERFRESLKSLKQNVKNATSPADKRIAKQAIKDALDYWHLQRTNLRKNHLDYTRLGPSYAKLYLADLKGNLEKSLSNIDQNPEIARRQLELYAHNKRVIELKGRATAWGIDAPAARKAIQQQMQDLGLAKFRAVVRAWNLFRATYEQHVIQDADVRAMLSAETIELMERNKHYVTMRHVATAEQTQQLLERLNNTPGSAIDIAVERLLPAAKTGDTRGISGYFKELTGSLQATESPLLATAKTATGILMAAKRNKAILELARALQSVNHPDATIVPWEQRVTTARTAPIEFYSAGRHLALQVPPIVAAGYEREGDTLRAVTHITRIINATLTTNNPAFVPVAYVRDLSAAAYNTPGLWRTPAHYLNPAAGDLAAIGMQFIPPHAMRALSKVPLLSHLIFNPHTVEYWSAFSRKVATIIHNGSFEKTLQDAQSARANGNHAKADELTYIVQMARLALKDGVLLNMLQFRNLEYNASEWKTLFSRYNLAWDDPDDQNAKLISKTWDIAKRLPAKTWNAFGDASEIEATTAKLTAYLYLHRDATPGSNPEEAPSFANPDTRTAIATHTAYNVGDPTFELRGHLATFVECAYGPFWNARQKGFLRTYTQPLNQATLRLDNNGNPTAQHPASAYAEKALKFAAKYSARLQWAAILTGGASAACLALYRALTGNDKATREEMQGSPLGTLADFFDWTKATLDNCLPYTLSNYNVIPIAKSGDYSLVITTPLSDEEKLPTLLADATTGLLGARPGASLQDAIQDLSSTLLQPPGGQSHADEALRLLQPWLFASNPFDPYRNSYILSDKTFAARWTTHNAATTMLKRAINTTPVSILFRTQPELEADTPKHPLFQLHQAIAKIPVLSTIQGRFIRIQVGGQTARATAVARLDQQERLIIQQQAENVARNFFTPGYQLPDYVNTYTPEQTQTFIDALNKSLQSQSPDAAPTQRNAKLLRALKSIHNPALLKYALP